LKTTYLIVQIKFLNQVKVPICDISNAIMQNATTNFIANNESKISFIEFLKLVLDSSGVHKILSCATPSDIALNVSTFAFQITRDLKFLVTFVTRSDKCLEIV